MSETVVEAKGHIPNADDGDCTTEIRCSVCNEITTKAEIAHTGGVATCKEKAKCERCGTEYGDFSNHTLTKTEAQAATCTEAGNIEYWTCSVCGKYFKDEVAAEEIELSETVVEAKGHNFIDGSCSNCGFEEQSTTESGCGGAITYNVLCISFMIIVISLVIINKKKGRGEN